MTIQKLPTTMTWLASALGTSLTYGARTPPGRRLVQPGAKKRRVERKKQKLARRNNR